MITPESRSSRARSPRSHALRRWRLRIAACLLLACACASQRRPAETVSDVLSRPSRGGRSPIVPRSERSEPTLTPDPSSNSLDDANNTAIAIVNGSPISRRQFVELLLKSHGVGILEPWIGLEAARQYAQSRHILVTFADIRRERELALQKLSVMAAVVGTEADASSVNPSSAEPNSAERSLEAVMAARNVSAEELELILRRNAYLRKSVEADLTVSEAELREEMDQVYGERVEVRHIQLATPAEVDRVLERLDNGEAFDDLARTHSANQASAARGGLLEPFSRRAEEWPELLRQTAFAMEPGTVSPALRVGPWYHILRLERRIPMDAREFGTVRPELDRRVRQRRMDPAMFALYEKLFRAATIEIQDAGLKAAFEKRHPERDARK